MLCFHLTEAEVPTTGVWVLWQGGAIGSATAIPTYRFVVRIVEQIRLAASCVRDLSEFALGQKLLRPGWNSL